MTDNKLRALRALLERRDSTPWTVEEVPKPKPKGRPLLPEELLDAIYRPGALILDQGGEGQVAETTLLEWEQLLDEAEAEVARLRAELDRATRERPESVFHGRDPALLREMLDFYAPTRTRVLDATANRRKMWKGLATGDVTFLDVEPAVEPDVVGDFTSMPFPDGSFDVIVFDPPHLPLAAASPASLEQYKRDYGLPQSIKADSIAALFPPFLLEARRVLRPDGLIFAKLKDYVHNHRYQWVLSSWVNCVTAVPGLTPCDLRIKIDPCGGNLKSGRWKRAHHARVVHTWWAVVRKGRCEAKKRNT